MPTFYETSTKTFEINLDTLYPTRFEYNLNNRVGCKGYLEDFTRK